MLTITISRPLVWLWRFRHRRGYGVHSPFAFDFITNVVYEHAPYYKYDELNEQVARQEAALGHAWSHREPLRLKQLLFRMVNRAQPARIIHIGPPSAIGLYLQAGRDGHNGRLPLHRRYQPPRSGRSSLCTLRRTGRTAVGLRAAGRGLHTRNARSMETP